MDVYLVRHGETDWNKTRRIQGNVNIPLNEKGRAVALATAEAIRDLPFDLIFCSPLDRARETAEILAAGCGREVIVDRRLREIEFGEFEGATWKEITTNPDYRAIWNFFEDPANYVPERGAESFESIMGRAQDFIDQEVLPREHTCDRMMIVAHGAFNRAFQACVRKADKADFWGASRQPMKNCGMSILEVKDGAIKITEEGKIYYDPTLFE